MNIKDIYTPERQSTKDAIETIERSFSTRYNSTLSELFHKVDDLFGDGAANRIPRNIPCIHGFLIQILNKISCGDDVLETLSEDEYLEFTYNLLLPRSQFLRFNRIYVLGIVLPIACQCGPDYGLVVLASIDEFDKGLYTHDRNAISQFKHYCERIRKLYRGGCSNITLADLLPDESEK